MKVPKNMPNSNIKKYFSGAVLDQWEREYTTPVYQLANSRPGMLLRSPCNVTASTHQNIILTKYQQFQIDP